MLWAYDRCSTTQQNLDRGLAAIKEYFETYHPGERYEIFTDKQTGKNFDRPDYKTLKRLVKQGDELVIPEVDRLGRNKYENLKELQHFKDNGVIIRVLELPTTLVDYSKLGDELAKMMMETVNNLLLELYSTLAHAEMSKREKRQREGIEQMKARGEWDKYGRPQLVSEKQFAIAYQAVEEKKITAVECMKQLGVGKTTFYKLRKQYLDNKK